MTRAAGLDASVAREVSLDKPVFMEQLGQGFGLVSYERDLAADECGLLNVDEVHDFGYVFLDGKYLGTLDRRHRGVKVSVPKAAGVVSRREVTPGTSPALFRGTLTVPSPPSSPSPTFSTSASFPADTFLDMTTWAKGIVWVNGHTLGRFWSVGPQQTLYVPGCWLKPGANEVVVLDFFGPRAACEIVSCDKPILDVLHPETDFNRRERPATRFTAGREAAQGTFPNTDAAQVVLFDKPVRGTSFTLQVRSSYDPKILASVAEFDLLGKDGNLL